MNKLSLNIQIEGEKRFADTDLYDAMSDGIVIYSPNDQKIIYANESYKNFDSPQQRDKSDDALKRFLQEKISEKEFLEKSGFSIIKLKKVSKPEQDDLILVVLIRSQKRPFSGHYEVLNNAEEKLKMGTWQYLVFENKLSISEGFARILGLNENSKNYPKNLQDYMGFVVPEEKDDILKLVENVIKTGQNFSDLVHTILVDNQRKIVSVSTLKIINNENKLLCLQGVIKDISKEKLEEVLKLKSISDLNKSNTALTEFAYTASHDLQEPLRKIEAYANRLERTLADQIPEQAKGYLGRLRGASVRMSELIDDILKLSRLNAKPPLDELIDLNTIIPPILNDYEEPINNSKAQITFDLPVLHGVRVQFQQLFQNLIGNGLKFKKLNEIPNITISNKLLKKSDYAQFGLDFSKTYYEITVKDNGIGFNPQFGDIIFSPFKRLIGRSEYPGTGIGLAICKKVVENHEGYIRAESEEGVGTTFIIYLPK
ncbi:hypothetical protein EGI22_13545 [Lacihabitans sp. LS3-19]|uniref:sensor histidine kinase n=1 Tax=Lacihabitans sp. LS3-19 TaxID=2487335 RepID=UPI0020CBED7F|nr:ATP-binding protein [Lacihabitans sp. LS3-19]MCP9768938.1 hypothetical protein [Lacihabitans sp. LS3-19]